MFLSIQLEPADDRILVLIFNVRCVHVSFLLHQTPISCLKSVFNCRRFLFLYDLSFIVMQSSRHIDLNCPGHLFLSEDLYSYENTVTRGQPLCLFPRINCYTRVRGVIFCLLLVKIERIKINPSINSDFNYNKTTS